MTNMNKRKKIVFDFEVDDIFYINGFTNSLQFWFYIVDNHPDGCLFKTLHQTFYIFEKN